MAFKLVGIGEVLWSLLPGGRQLGGAPANFSYHASALSASARIISRVGNDANGRDILEQLRKLGVPTDCIELDPDAPTGTVSVEVASDGQPRFTIHENVAWDCITGEVAGCRAVAAADAVCFGTLAQRSETSRRAIRALLKAAPAESLRILDVNLRQHFYSRELIEDSLALANVIKVNDTELPLLAEMFHLSGDDRSQIDQLAGRYQLRAVALTRGGSGSLLFADGRWSDHPGAPTKVVDTVGAGDSLLAGMLHGVLSADTPEQTLRTATAIAAMAVTQIGFGIGDAKQLAQLEQGVRVRPLTEQ